MKNFIRVLIAVSMTTSLAFKGAIQIKYQSYSAHGNPFVTKAVSADANDELQRANDDITRSLLSATANSLSSFFLTERLKEEDQIGKAGAVVLGALCSLYFIHDLYAAAAAACLTSVLASRSDNLGDATRKAGNLAVELVKLAAEFEKESNAVKSLGLQLSQQFSSLVLMATAAESENIITKGLTDVDVDNLSLHHSTVPDLVTSSHITSNLVDDAVREPQSLVESKESIAVLEDHYASKWTQAHADLFYGWGPIYTPEEGTSIVIKELVPAEAIPSVAVTPITSFEAKSTVASPVATVTVSSKLQELPSEPEKDPEEDEEEQAPVDELEAWRQWGRDIDWGLVKLSGSLIYEELQKGIIQAGTKSTPVYEDINETDNLTDLFTNANSKISKRQGGKVKNGKVVLPDEILEHVAAHGGTVGKMKRLSTVPLASLQKVMTERRGGEADTTVATVGKRNSNKGDSGIEPLDELEMRQQERIQTHLAKKEAFEALQNAHSNADTSIANKRKSPTSSIPSTTANPVTSKSSAAKVSSTAPVDSYHSSSSSAHGSSSSAKPKHSGLTSAEFEARNAWRKLAVANRDFGSSSSSTSKSKTGNQATSQPNTENDTPETFEQMKLRVTRQWVMEICERARQIEETRQMKKSMST